MKRALTVFSLLLPLMTGAGCSSQGSKKTESQAARTAPPASFAMMAENRKHPLAKYIEIAGFRLTEKSQGKINAQFAVINHSNADISELGLNVTLKAATAKPDEPGFCTFSAKVAALTPLELKNAAGECPTALRIYELPDWQFIRATFEITAPAL